MLMGEVLQVVAPVGQMDGFAGCDAVVIPRCDVGWAGEAQVRSLQPRCPSPLV